MKGALLVARAGTKVESLDLGLQPQSPSPGARLPEEPDRGSGLTQAIESVTGRQAIPKPIHDGLKAPSLRDRRRVSGAERKTHRILTTKIQASMINGLGFYAYPSTVRPPGIDGKWPLPEGLKEI